MEEDYKIIDHYLMIRLPEEIDHHSCSVICRRADHMMLDNSVSHIVFDFSDTKFMDSSGIGVLAGRYRKISCFGGKVYVIHANRRIRKILEMSGIGDIVEMIDQEEYTLCEHFIVMNKIFQSRDLCLRALDTNSACAKSVRRNERKA